MIHLAYAVALGGVYLGGVAIWGLVLVGLWKLNRWADRQIDALVARVFGQKKTGAVKPPAEPACASPREPQVYAPIVNLRSGTVLTIAALALSLTSCAWLMHGAGEGGNVEPPDPVKACRLACDAAGLAGAPAATVHTCLLACEGKTLPPPRATPTIAATVIPTATVAPTAPPVETAVPVGGICQETHAGATPKAFYAADVEAAERAWIDANPDKWRRVAAQWNVHEQFRDSMQFDIARALRAKGYQVAVEANGHGTPVGALAVAKGPEFHEGYSVQTSSRDVRFPFNGNAPNGFMGRCEPRGFDAGGPRPTPTATPAATPPVVPYVPPSLDRWRGCTDSNMSREVAQDGTERARRFCDTTPHWVCPMVPPSVGGSRSCDPEHAIVFADCCSGRRADDPRGPSFQVKRISGGVVEVRQPCRNGNYFNACFFAPAGTVAQIEVCPRADAYTCAVAAELPNIDTGIRYDPADPRTDCPSGKVPIPVRGTGCFGWTEVRF